MAKKYKMTFQRGLNPVKIRNPDSFRNRAQNYKKKREHLYVWIQDFRFQIWLRRFWLHRTLFQFRFQIWRFRYFGIFHLFIL